MNNFIKLMLLLQFIGGIVSSIIYAIGFPNDDRWFSRFAFACICLGIYGIIITIEDKNIS